MRKVCTAFTAIFVSFMLFVMTASSAGASLDVDYKADMNLRVALYYGNDARATANIYTETGYTFGYYKEDSFVDLYRVDEYFIAVAKDTALYWLEKDNILSETSVSGYSAIGNYHLEITNEFTRSAANTAVNNALNAGYKAFSSYENGIYRVRIGQYSSLDAAKNAQESVESKLGVKLQAVGNRDSVVTVIDMNSGNIIFEFQDADRNFAVRPKTGQFRMNSIWYSGDIECRRNGGGNISIINMVSMQDYLKGVVPYEVSASWHIEALKTQAVISRSFAYATIFSRRRHISSGFDLCNTTCCQVYKGKSIASERVDRAVDETYGIIAVYNNKVAETYFHSSSGGYTENVENVWGGTALPYLRAVQDTFDPISAWTSSVTPEELRDYLNGKGYNIQDIVDVSVEYTVPAGNVYSVTIRDKNNKTVEIKTTDKVRIELSRYVKSPHFTIRAIMSGTSSYIDGNSGLNTGNASDLYAVDGNGNVKKVSGAAVATGSGTYELESKIIQYEFSGAGNGHNVGLSQYGAKAMAEQGYDFSSILNYYFTGITVYTLK